MNTGIVYNSVQDASELLNIETSSIYRVCNGTYTSTNGLLFQYERNMENVDVEELWKRAKLIKKLHSSGNPVVCISDNNRYFDNMTLAGEYYHIDRSDISRAIKYNRCVKGYKFQYAKEPTIKNCKIKIFSQTDNLTFDSMKSCIAHYHISYYALKRKLNNEFVKGWENIKLIRL